LTFMRSTREGRVKKLKVGGGGSEFQLRGKVKEFYNDEGGSRVEEPRVRGGLLSFP